jgi:acetoin utilization deacetylase AcuC-like enzyme
MPVVHHPDQALHNPDTVFHRGHFIPQPDPAERYRIFREVARHEGYSIAEAPLGSLAPILDVHYAGYVEFLKTAHHRWSAQPDYGPSLFQMYIQFVASAQILAHLSDRWLAAQGVGAQ